MATASSTPKPSPLTTSAPQKLASCDLDGSAALAHVPLASPRPTNDALLAGHAQGDCPTEDLQECKFEVAENAPEAAHPPPDDDDEDEEAWKKRYNSCEAKLRRICEPKGVSGKLEADSQLVQQWKAKGHTRTQLVKLMMEADGSKEH